MADPKPYNPSPLDPRWTDVAYRSLLRGDLTASINTTDEIVVAEVSGKCPYCEHHLHYVEVRTAVTEGTVTTLGEGARYETITITCGCPVLHPEAPNKGTGCGTTFLIDVLAS